MHADRLNTFGCRECPRTFVVPAGGRWGLCSHCLKANHNITLTRTGNIKRNK